MQNTMEVFKTHAMSGNQELASDYSMAAQQVDMTCGPRFVESDVQMSSAAQHAPRGIEMTLLGLLVVVFHFLCC